jgi:bifunctional enzyme CysN/CysC
MGSIAFVELHVDTPLAVAEQRDSRGLYANARRGDLPSFSEIGWPYEPPESLSLRVDKSVRDVAAAADEVLALLRQRGALPPT